ncbi:hypothetical protein ESA_pESA3p05460 (plasmid) [Cronobacter sakazakii ATCC BAA-894]|uniref:Uncharacterized protein n=1 Tax=Cronobacter sakazakii (strain ATCC BAA-894) TaxID=290339 RepID=A7MRQ2_CROS8|nr:hypothetical protein ESA_pESA3p05460 [Cronobacter sakazakii ATCC BAA-894]
MLAIKKQTDQRLIVTFFFNAGRHFKTTKQFGANTFFIQETTIAQDLYDDLP